jgi:hypothetical protein
MSNSAIIVAGNDVQVILDALATAGTLSKYFPDASDEVTQLSKAALRLRCELLAQPIIREDFVACSTSIKDAQDKNQSNRVLEAVHRAVHSNAPGRAFQ